MRATPAHGMKAAMCRNIRVLHHFEPPSTRAEVEAAALQYVRKVGGIKTLRAQDQATVELAVARVTEATIALLNSLSRQGDPRTRDGERDRARAQWAKREAALAKRFAARR